RKSGTLGSGVPDRESAFYNEQPLSGSARIPIHDGRDSMRLLRFVAVVLMAAVLAHESRLAGSQRTGLGGMKTRNILLVTTDGLRWQEVFGGAARALRNGAQGGVADVAALKSKFDRATPEDRRKALMPFFWSVIAQDGQLFGDATAGSEAKVTNGRNFSY